MSTKDVPLDAPGIPWDVWHEQQVERIFAEARERRDHQSVPKTDAEKNHRSQLSAISREEERLLDISPCDE